MLYPGIGLLWAFRENKVEVKVPQDSAIVVEEESVVIEVDTLIPDTTRK